MMRERLGAASGFAAAALTQLPEGVLYPAAVADGASDGEAESRKNGKDSPCREDSQHSHPSRSSADALGTVLSLIGTLSA
jgi:hypothetical protein